MYLHDNKIMLVLYVCTYVYGVACMYIVFCSVKWCVPIWYFLFCKIVDFSLYVLVWNSINLKNLSQIWSAANVIIYVHYTHNTHCWCCKIQCDYVHSSNNQFNQFFIKYYNQLYSQRSVAEFSFFMFYNYN